MRTHWTKDQEQEVQRLYEAGWSTRKLGERFERNAETVRMLLHRAGTRIRSREEACTKYRLNKHFFDTIDTEEKAYWLGFLTADGGIVGHQLVVSLKTTDFCHLEKLLLSLQSSHPIKFVKCKINRKEIIQPRLVISSIGLIRALREHGVGERKSLVVKPANLESKLRVPYWRGYFDGDGHITVTEYRRLAEVTGNRFMLTGYSHFLSEQLGVCSKLTKSKSVYRVRHGKRSAVKDIARLLYCGASIYLDRKYEIARQIFEDPTFHLRKNARVRRIASPAADTT